jgi:hypothetical protein
VEPVWPVDRVTVRRLEDAQLELQPQHPADRVVDAADRHAAVNVLME